MLFIRLKTTASRDTVMKILFETKDAAKPDEKHGRPSMLLSEKGEKIKVSCSYIDGTSRDFGKSTYFVGRLREKDGETRLSGIIVTEPLFHVPFLALLVFFICRSVMLGAINVVPICLTVFCILMFRTEYGKQPLIRRYLRRAFLISERIEK